MEIMITSLGDMLMKVGMFFLIQALVYVILSNSSNIFSKSPVKKSHSFKPTRSVSIRRMLAILSDMPPEGEPSPNSSKGPLSPAVANSKLE